MHVNEAEQHTSAVEDTNVETEERISYLEKTVALLQERLDDQEDRGKRKNLRIISLPESSEGSSAINFMETWIPKILNLTTKVKPGRAHQVSQMVRRAPEHRRPGGQAG